MDLVVVVAAAALDAAGQSQNAIAAGNRSVRDDMEASVVVTVVVAVVAETVIR